MGLFGWKKKNETDFAVAMAEAAGLNDELIAVITAAVCAYEAEQYVKSLHIRKLNRAAGVRPAWSATGTNEAIDVRRL